MPRVIGTALVLAILAGVLLLIYVRTTGLDARPLPGSAETVVARAVRRFAVPPDIRNRPNPVAASAAALDEGLGHFADHCASCHANDGSGDTEMGRGMYPKAPDMRLAPTQDLTDGELFYIIERGIRFTGMPAWSTGTPEGEESSWKLVHFIRHLPRITEADLERMQGMNPAPPESIRQQIAEEQFLGGAQ